MDYTQNSLKTQIFGAFDTIDACINAVSDKKNALLLFDFVYFCRLADPLFSEIWGADWLQTAQIYIYATGFKSGDKRPVSVSAHTFEGWPRGGRLTAQQMIDALRTGQNYYIARDGSRPMCKHVAILTEQVAVIDIDCHNSTLPDQREGLLKGLEYLKQAAIAEPTSNGMHIIFKQTQGCVKHITGHAQAQDEQGRPIKLEIIACSRGADGALRSPQAIVLGCGRVEGYAMTAQTLTARLCTPGAVFGPIPSVLIPERDESGEQPAVGAQYQALPPVQPMPQMPLAAPIAPPQSTQPPQPPTCVFPPVTMPQPQPAAPVTVPPAVAAAQVWGAQASYQVGNRNETLFRRLTELSKSIIYGDDAPVIMRALAQAEYAAMPDKSSFSHAEVDGVVKSVLDRMQAGSSAAAAKRQAQELRLLCRSPREAVAWAMAKLGAEPVSYNRMTREVVSAKPIDLLVTDIYNTLQRQMTRDEIGHELTYSSQERSTHPVLEWLKTLPASRDDTELNKLCALLGASPISRAYITHWLMQAVCALYNGSSSPEGDPEHYPCEYVLVLHGPQGAGKTSLLRHLAVRQSWWIGGAKINGDKDNSKRILHHWIAELGEIGSTMRHDQDSLKAFISQEFDAYRLPWGRADITAARQTALCGSVNDDEFLCDPSGGRRFWIVPVSRRLPREAILSIDVAALWAYIYTVVNDRHSQGVPYGDIFRLPPDAEQSAQHVADGYRKRTSTEAELESMIILDDVADRYLNWRTAREVALDMPWVGARPQTGSVGKALAALRVRYRDLGGRRREWGIAVSAEIAREITAATLGRSNYIPTPTD